MRRHTLPSVPKIDLFSRNDVPGPYRGHDRRALIAPTREGAGRPFFIAGFGLVGLTALVFLSAMFDAGSQDLESVAASFELSAAALGVVAATLCVVRWRLAGDARALWLGTAVGVYSVFSIALSYLLPYVLSNAPAYTSWTRLASLVVTMTVFAYALRSPEVDARMQPVLTFAIATGAVVALTALLMVASIVGLLAFSNDAASLSAVIGLVWAALATIYILRGMSEGRMLFAWYGLAMFGLTLAELALAYGPESSTLQLGSAMIRSFALLAAVIGVTRELTSMFASQSSRLLKTMVDTMASNASLQAATRQREELAHEARNALTAIEGATQTLERFRENLDDGTRHALAVAVSDEIGRLQRLVGASPSTNHPVSFRLADIVRPQIDLARAQGAQVSASVPTDLVAYGRPPEFAEVLQNLLVNARLHGRNPVTVRAVQRDDHVEVRVDDRGPGVPADLRAAIFERGKRASDAAGSGLGLYLSRELMRGQQGALWVEDRPGGGASFVVVMPSGASMGSLSFSDSGRLQPVAQRVGNGGKPANGHRTLAGASAQDPDARARAHRRQRQHPVD